MLLNCIDDCKSENFIESLTNNFGESDISPLKEIRMPERDFKKWPPSEMTSLRLCYKLMALLFGNNVILCNVIIIQYVGCGFTIVLIERRTM